MDYSNMTVKEIIKKTRHKAEKPLWVLAFIFTGIVYAISGIFGLFIKLSPELYSMLLESTDGDKIAIALLQICNSIGFGCFIMVVAVLAILMTYGLYKAYAVQMAYSVRVSETNFPEIYAKAEEFSKKLELKKVPEIYITQENGKLNAFATMVPGKRYIQLNAEIVDVAYMENKNFDIVYFIMAHEFGHIYLKHITLQRNLFSVFFKLIPFFGNLLSRSMEYSADRVAQALTDDTATIETMMVLGAGRHLYKYIDANDYISKALGKYNLLERIARFFYNISKTHPIMPYRVKALLDPNRKSGRLI